MIPSTSSARSAMSTGARRISISKPKSRRGLTSAAADRPRLVSWRPDASVIAPAKPVRKSRDYLNLPADALAYHWDTKPPKPSQLAYADSFFLTNPSKLLWSAAKFRTIDFGSLPEVAFLGRSNVGKSSLLNAVLQRKISHTSSKPGRTRTMNAFGVGEEDGRGNDGKLVVLDMPGYGMASREEWGKEIMKYLVGRKE